MRRHLFMVGVAALLVAAGKPADEAKKITMSFTGNRHALKSGIGFTDGQAGTQTLDPTKKPKQTFEPDSVGHAFQPDAL
jgi:hypothetical protein